MKNKHCIVCNKLFSGRGLCCSPECSFIRKQQAGKKYREEHKEEIAKYQKLKAKERYMTSFSDYKIEPKNPSPKPKAKDPEWITNYLKADRLTKISMLAIALTDLGILMSYGKLSPLWGTEKYSRYEQQVFREKRKQYANNNSSKKNSTKSKKRSKDL